MIESAGKNDLCRSVESHTKVEESIRKKAADAFSLPLSHPVSSIFRGFRACQPFWQFLLGESDEINRVLHDGIDILRYTSCNGVHYTDTSIFGMCLLASLSVTNTGVFDPNHHQRNKIHRSSSF